MVSECGKNGGLAQLGERLHGMQEVRGSSPLSSTIGDKRPFGEHVEGLSYCGAKSCGPDGHRVELAGSA